MAVMLSNYINYKGAELSETGGKGAFSDSADISPWAGAAVADMHRLGLINGTGDSRYNPRGTATRAEVATNFP